MFVLWFVVIWISVVEISYLQSVSIIDYNNLDKEVEKQCIEHCHLQNQTDGTRLDYNCNNECNTEQCSKGCIVWKESLTSSCHKACNGTSDRLSQRELHCVIGCNDAIGKYFARVRTVLGKPPAPALLDNSLTATTLKLEWRFKEAWRARLSAHLQWRYEEISATWQYCRNVTWQPEISSFYVQALQPYTKYRFRVALNLGLHNFGADAIYSERSVVIATLAAGPPASPPQHVNAAPVDAHSVSVTWEPGPFPHGPLLSYVLHITETGSSARPGYQGRTEVKDVPSTTTFHLFRDVPANENLTVSVQMRNSYGPGPASIVHVTTPKEVKASENLQPILILGTRHGIFQLESLFGDGLHLFHSDHTAIEGIGIHIDKQLLFVSDADGYVWRFPVEQETKNRTAILSPNQLDILPLDISVDWISNLLYIVGEMKSVKPNGKKMFLIQRCTLDGRALTVAYAGLQSRPTAMEVDPCNGYIFWSVHDDEMSGLYRLDTSDISNGIKHEKRPDLILKKPNLGAFLIDCSNFRLYVADQGANTILSLSLDGKSVKNIRTNVVNPKLQYVLSLGMVNQKFYWTDGSTVFNEEYHKGLNQYYHNRISHLGKTQFQNILINMNGSQPWPIPLNPPTSLQLIFGSTTAKAKWFAPHLLPLQGKGACQNWTYELFVHDVTSNITVTYYSQTPSMKFGHLKPNTEYLIKVLAFTKSGKGPWSVEFRGTTLDNARNSSIIWSGSEGLVRTDPVMNKVETLIHKSRMRNIAFDDMTWYKDQIYLVTNSSQVYWFNLTSRKQGRLIDVDSVGSLAVDWIGQKLYWSNLKQQLIVRGNLNGSKQEPLPILALVKEIRIDSLNGYLYWSSGFDVECAHLNGDDRIRYDHLEPFSGKQVMGLTLDFDSHYVYWIVRGQEGSHLYRASMMGPGVTVNKIRVALLARTNIAGPLSYFDGRLLWLRDEKMAAISDMNGAYVATMEGKSLSGLKMVYAIDDSLQNYSGDDETNLNVIPDLVDKLTIRTVGSSESFNITWSAVLNVNYGKVFYEVQLDGPHTNYSNIITSEPNVGYLENVSPFTPLNVTIRPFTYWASAPQTRTVVYSPPSTPSAPTNLRAFVSYDHNNSLHDSNWFTVTFRWDPPTYPNGILQGYYVRCWTVNNQTENISLCDGIVKLANETEHVLSKLTVHGVFSFQIQAFTEIGTGSPSAIQEVNSTEENPVPIIVTTTTDSICLHDLDNNRSTVLVANINTPLKVVYLLRENKLFWINEMRELLVLHSTNNKSKLADLKGEPKGLTIDWVGRCLYVLESFNQTNGSVIRKVDLNYLPTNKIVIIYVNATANITEIAVSPYARKLYWNENGTVFSSDLNASNVKSIFPDDDSINKVESFQLNHYLTKVTLTCLLNNNYTVTLDEDGENCSSNAIFTTNNFLLRYGKQMQPYPSKQCLSPQQSTEYKAIVMKKSYDYLSLSMPEAVFGFDCPKVSIPPTVYTGTYATLPDFRENTFTTFEKTYRVNGLKPFTEYSVRIAVTNYYTDVNTMKFGQILLVKTSPGAPSKPRNITAKVLHPTLAVTEWLPPLQLNGEIVHYEIHWLTEGSLTGVRQKGEQPVNELTTPENQTVHLTALLQKLSPNETYTVWIRAYSETNETSSDSDRVQITTYPEPAVFELVNKTSRSLQLIWEITPHIDQHYVEYALITSSEQWERVQAPEKIKEGVVSIFVDNLNPKTRYKFRLSLLYEQYPKWYVWPSDSRFTFETLGDRPDPPGQPAIQVHGFGYKVVWDAPVDNGAPILLYSLECLVLRWYRHNKRSAAQLASNWSYALPSADETPYEWEQVYNGTDNFWIIEGLNPAHKYAFRVSALNSHGWSDLSEESTEFSPGEAAHLHQKNPINLIFFATLLPISVCFIIVVCFGYVTYSRRCRKQKEVEQAIPMRCPGLDVELATLREQPRRGVHSTNILYVPSANPEDDLPHIRRDQITLTKFLGSGAFGEVFEGKAKGLSADMTETKVAVKTFKTGASDLKKTEFLKEAKLMSHFKHEHILKLLGVCLDNDPPFIIMELMEGGDLLTYLRESRGGLNNKPSLALIDLLKMCLDVTKGCRYLEIMHFIHRDLACRNCLVSSVESENRIVKIGDFGLARDIYKNDYYRKEGEALLPVRWMAPESLLDGVFTCQSDVWAFGVLLWEIMTMGQRPYQARDNSEVLHYLKSGGRLGKPTDCPEELYQLMLKCWTFEAGKRPMFKHCLEVLEKAYNDHLTSPETSESNYINTVPDLFEGISNAAYFLDENRNTSGNSWKTESELDDSLKEKTPFLNKDIPKYLELVYEPKTEESEFENDGYEVPTEMIRSSESSESTEKV